MKRVKRFFKALFFLGVLLGVLGLAARAYVLPLARETLARGVRAAGFPKAVAEVKTEGISHLTIRLREEPAGRVLGEVEVWPWSRSTLRLSRVRVDGSGWPSLPEKDKAGAATSPPWWEKAWVMPWIPYRAVVVEEVEGLVPGIGLVRGALTARREDGTGWRADVTFEIPGQTTAGTAHVMLSPAGTYTVDVGAEKKSALPFLAPSVAIHAALKGGAPEPVLSGDLSSAALSVRLNPEKKAGLTALPLVADVTVPQSQPGPLHVTGALNLVKRTAALSVTGDIQHPSVEIAGLKATLNLSSLWPLETSDQQLLRADRVVVAGFPLTQVRAHVGYRDGQVRVQRASALALGGKVSVKPLAFALPLHALEATVVLEDVDLGQALVLAGVEGLGGAGRLSGALPVRYQQGRLSFGQGRVNAREAGTLAYTPAHPPAFLAEGGQGALLAQVFSDFRYKALTLRLEGTPGDTLTLGAHLEGSNPSFYDGHPVSFTLTLSGDLDTVLQQGLKGLRLSPEALQGLIQQGATP